MGFFFRHIVPNETMIIVHAPRPARIDRESAPNPFQPLRSVFRHFYCLIFIYLPDLQIRIQYGRSGVHLKCPVLCRKRDNSPGTMLYNGRRFVDDFWIIVRTKKTCIETRLRGWFVKFRIVGFMIVSKNQREV